MGLPSLFYTIPHAPKPEGGSLSGPIFETQFSNANDSFQINKTFQCKSAVLSF